MSENSISSPLCERLRLEKQNMMIVKKNDNFLILEKGKNKPILLISCIRDATDPLSINYLSKAICDAQAVKNEYGSAPFIVTVGSYVSVIFAPIDNMCKKTLSLNDYSLIISRYRYTIIPTSQLKLDELLDEIAKDEAEKKRKDIQSFLIIYLRDHIIKSIIEYLREHKSLFMRPDVLSRLNDEAKKLGYENGVSIDESAKGSLYLDNLLRMMAYVLLDKIIFYKILENHYDLRRLVPLYRSGVVKNSQEYLTKLNELFNEAKSKTGNFDVVFSTGIYDLIQLGTDNEIAQVLDSLIILLESQDLDQFVKIIGYIYESLIPPEERHKLGQFYTPPPIVELITKWAIRSANDRVLDAGTGSGAFIAEAYDRLFYLKTGKRLDIMNGVTPSQSEHFSILGKLYAIDIDPFAVHLTAIRLSLKSPKYPATDLNVIINDFFKIKPAQSTLLIPKAMGGKTNNIVFSGFDAVIGNPPYTRWSDLNIEGRKAVKEALGNILGKYNLTPKGREGIPLYVYWIVHAERFLKDHGRLGMIISNMWLQAEYGKYFTKYLLDHFEIKAIIDVTQKIFDALITTAIVLLEKERDMNNRANNKVLIARIIPIDEKKVTETLKCMERSINANYDFDENKLRECSGLWFKFIKQAEIRTDQKLISLFFNTATYEELERLVKEGKMIRLGDWFEPSRGNGVYECLANWGILGTSYGHGAKEFFRFDENKKINGVKSQKGVIKVPEECLYPAILDAELIQSFSFTKKDWDELRSKGRDAYLFVCHKPKNEQIKDYIEWGERECRNRSGRPCSEAVSARIREEEKTIFYGWYDLGGILTTPLFTKYASHYFPLFFISKFPVASNDSFIAFIPKVSIDGYNVEQLRSILVKFKNKKKVAKEILNEIEKNSKIILTSKELKALVAYLNSTLIWNWLELRGRAVAGGPLDIDLNPARNIPIPNVKELSEKDIDDLAKLFDELDAEARKHKDTRKSLELLNLLKPIKQKIDRKICEIYGLKIDVDALWDLTIEMMERRVPGKSGKKLDLGVEKDPESVKRMNKTISLESFM